MCEGLRIKKDMIQKLEKYSDTAGSSENFLMNNTEKFNNIIDKVNEICDNINNLNGNNSSNSSNSSDDNYYNEREKIIKRMNNNMTKETTDTSKEKFDLGLRKEEFIYKLEGIKRYLEWYEMVLDETGIDIHGNTDYIYNVINGYIEILVELFEDKDAEEEWENSRIVEFLYGNDVMEMKSVEGKDGKKHLDWVKTGMKYINAEMVWREIMKDRGEEVNEDGDERDEGDED